MSERPEPPFPAQQQEPPGSTEQMSPRPDHGEDSYVGQDRLRDRVALVTGADSGIGKAVALAYAREGADVAISYLNEHDDAKDTARLVEAAGRRALLLPGDIGDETFCREAVRRTVGELGGLHVLVNNAAYQRTHEDPLDISAEEVERTFRTNVFALVHLVKAAAPHLGDGGVVVNTTSIQAFDPSPQLLAYAATKAAIVNLTQSLAQALTPRGIRVNGVAPGPVWTPLVPSTMPEEKSSRFGADTPMGRPAQPAELAPIFVFLASAESSYLSGQTVGVTGGKPLP